MKIYSVCEYCQEIFESSDIEGPDGVVELKGICDRCQGELRSYEDSTGMYYRSYYH